MSNIFRLIRYIKNSRGFSPIRLSLTAVYFFSFVYGAVLFPSSIGNYPIQALSIFMFVVGLWLSVKSLKKIFDERMRESIRRISRKIGSRVYSFFEKIGRKIAKKLGLERRRVKGEDERDFFFMQREEKRRRRSRMQNPHPWNNADNATRVRFIFTEYMFGKIKEGYRILPKYTPSKMERDLAHEELEHALFNTYTTARYSGGAEEISDATVEELDELVDKKRKRKR